MLKGRVVVGLSQILLLCDPKDVKMLEMKTVPGMPQSRSRREAIEDILKYTETAAKLLRQPSIKKAILKTYLKEAEIADPKDLTKDDCIRCCLELWNVEDDSFEKYRTEDDINRALSRLEAQEVKKIKEIRLRYEQKKKPLLDSLRKIQKRCLDSSSLDASSTVVSPSTSMNTKFRFPIGDALKPLLKKRKQEDSTDKINTVMEKPTKKSFPAVTVEHTGVTPDVRPKVPARILSVPTPDSSDTSTSFWGNWESSLSHYAKSSVP